MKLTCGKRPTNQTRDYSRRFRQNVRSPINSTAIYRYIPERGQAALLRSPPGEYCRRKVHRRLGWRRPKDRGENGASQAFTKSRAGEGESLASVYKGLDRDFESVEAAQTRYTSERGADERIFNADHEINLTI